MSYYQRQRDSELKAIHATWFAAIIAVFFVAGIGGMIVGISLEQQVSEEKCQRQIQYYKENWRPIYNDRGALPAR